MRMDQRGQAQILMASALATVMLTSALYALQHAQQVSKQEIRGTYRAELRTAVELGVKHAATIYRNEAGCDPTRLNERLARMMPDGSVGPAPGSDLAIPDASIQFGNLAPDYRTLPGAPLTGYHRSLDVNVNGRRYVISFGPVYSVTRTDGRNFAAEDATRGAGPTPATLETEDTTMDAMVEVWSSTNNVKVIQRAVLVNNCTYPCMRTDQQNGVTGGFCPGLVVAVDAGQAYASIPQADQGDVAACGAGLVRRRGDVDDLTLTGSNVCGPRVTDTTDLHILRNYLRSGTMAGSCRGMLNGTNDPLDPCDCAGTGPPICADLNGDSLVDEADLTILEKFLRGYLTGTPI